MTSAVRLYFLFLKALSALLLAGMVVLVFGNVVLRYGFNSGIVVSEELSRWMFVWLTFLGAIVALREKAHLGIDSVVRRLPRQGRKACFLLSYGLMLYAVVLLLIGSWEQSVINWDVVAPASDLSVAWFYGIGIVFGVSTIPILVGGMIQVAFSKVADDELISVRESEETEDLEALQKRHLVPEADFQPLPAARNGAAT
jgi:TRAP-type transport system small permease protein